MSTAKINVNESEVFGRLETAALLGAEELISYFQSPTPSKAKIARASMGIKAVSSYAGVRKTRAQEAGTVVKLAELAGLKGEALAPVFRRLTGEVMADYQEGGEQSGDTETAGTARE